MTTTILQVFARRGRIIFCRSKELDDLLQGSEDDIVGMIPIVFYKEDAQLRKADAKEFANLLPATILTSPYRLNIGQTEKDMEYFNANSEPFDTNELTKAVRKLNMFKLLGI